MALHALGFGLYWMAFQPGGYAFILEACVVAIIAVRRSLGGPFLAAAWAMSLAELLFAGPASGPLAAIAATAALLCTVIALAKRPLPGFAVVAGSAAAAAAVVWFPTLLPIPRIADQEPLTAAGAALRALGLAAALAFSAWIWAAMRRSSTKRAAEASRQDAS